MFNRLKTVILLGALTGILLLIGSLFGRTGLTFAFIFAILMNFGSLFFSHKLVLAIYRAKEIKRSQAPELHKMIEGIAKDMNLPKPKIYLIPTDHLNAFTSGPTQKKAVVAFTQGIINKLSNRELKGVAAHELAHIKNRDMLVSTIAATIAAVISYVVFMARWAAIFGGVGRDNDSGNVFELLALAIVAPIAALIIQLAISRSREYLADASGAKSIKDPEALSSALI
ncbi:MAG: M48 family metalloprotease, partial [Nanoarchaeota archaeon]